MDALGKLTGLFAIIIFLFTLKTKVDVALRAIRAPASLNFYFLFFWALAAAIIGGFVWAVCQQAFPSLGSPTVCAGHSTGGSPSLGGSREPHGLAAFLWPVVTNIPSLALMAVLTARYHLFPIRGTIVALLTVLLALAATSLAFYDIPLFGFKGMRRYLESKHLGYAPTEMYLVLIWSAALSSIPFLSTYAMRTIGTAVSFTGSLVAIGLTVGLTTSAVGFFVLGYPLPEYESARGVAAGLALRVSVFFGFLVSSRP
jgi:hypothetical protein